MTTPRDDIAVLIERLRERAATRNTLTRVPDTDFATMGYYSAGSATLDREAATQLDSLLKEREGYERLYNNEVVERLRAEQERDALQARVKELESGIAHAQYRSDNCDAENQSLYNRLEAVESRATRLQQEREIAQFGFEHELQIKKELADALRKAQQERDEAYERLINIDRIVHIPTSGKEAALHHFQRDFDAIRAITQPYRRLAGPEKEKKECNLGKDGGGDTSAGRLTAFASDGEEREKI